MALMFPRVARNFVKNGYFPTDEGTLERCLTALAPSAGTMLVVDPCAGEGVAIAEVAHALGRANVHAYAVEYNMERAAHARNLVDRCLYANLMDTIISRQAFGLLWLNPPYGDLVRDQGGGHEFRGRARLEKLFYRHSVPLLQYGGVLIYIIPVSTLDAELIGWLTRDFTDLRVYRAVDSQFRQIVIFGRRTRSFDQITAESTGARSLLRQIERGDLEPDELPAQWPFAPYIVPTSSDPKHFYRVSIDPEQFAREIQRLKGLWPELETHLGAAQQTPRPPARALSPWHRALALAAGAIRGVVRSKTGKVFIVKGDTHKEKSEKIEYAERDDGEIRQTRILTDRFVPVIRAWDMTPGSDTRGKTIVIR